MCTDVVCSLLYGVAERRRKRKHHHIVKWGCKFLPDLSRVLPPLLAQATFSDVHSLMFDVFLGQHHIEVRHESVNIRISSRWTLLRFWGSLKDSMGWCYKFPRDRIRLIWQHRQCAAGSILAALLLWLFPAYRHHNGTLALPKSRANLSSHIFAMGGSMCTCCF